MLLLVAVEEWSYNFSWGSYGDVVAAIVAFFCIPHAIASGRKLFSKLQLLSPRTIQQQSQQLYSSKMSQHTIGRLFFLHFT